MKKENTATKTHGADPAGFTEITPGMKMNWLGLTKREYFAAKALQGILAANLVDNSTDDDAAIAVNAADELIKALNCD